MRHMVQRLNFFPYALLWSHELHDRWKEIDYSLVDNARHYLLLERSTTYGGFSQV